MTVPADPGAPDSPPPGPARSILHVDMDAFFVAVELLDAPELRGRPVVVGGDGRRGVVAAASYEARRHGVHSAMPAALAARRCPDLVFLPGRYHRYAEVSRRIMALFTTDTPLVEPISLDEAFLDVTGARRLLGDAETIAHQLRQRVLDAEGLWCSVGVASTKFVAKLASAAAKPRPRPGGTEAGHGVLVVADDSVRSFLDPLAVSALWGVGPATLARLESIGVHTVADLAGVPIGTLTGLLGESAGTHLHRLALGIDPRPVVPDRAAKSVGHEQTYAADLTTRDAVERELLRLADAVIERLGTQGRSGITVVVKVRHADFTTVTRSVTLPSPVETTDALAAVARRLAATVPIGEGIRLLGVSISGLDAPTVPRQLSFDDLMAASPTGGVASESPGAAPDAGWGLSAAGVQQAINEIRARWGTRAIGPAALLGEDGLALRRRGDAAWGPGPVE